jgi:hypothetical protein
MSDDREEQIRRLAVTLGHIDNSVPWHTATALYDAGARIPDPPVRPNRPMGFTNEPGIDFSQVVNRWSPPTLPVVSSKALGAFLAAYGGGSDLYAKRGLRAAWPIMVRDNFAVLRSFTYPDGSSFQLGRDTIDAIIAALTGQPHG